MGRPGECDNYRGNTLTNFISKIYGKPIKNRIFCNTHLHREKKLAMRKAYDTISQSKLCKALEKPT